MNAQGRLAKTLLPILGDRRGGIALDVGAHTGEFAGELLASGLFGRVVAFEPNPDNALRIERGFAGDERLAVERCAVGASEGIAELVVDDDTATGSLLPYAQGYETKGAVRRLHVPVVSLDAWRVAVGGTTGPVTFLKIDTQGNDLAVLEGARGLIASDRPAVRAELIYVFLYENQASPHAIHDFMTAAGYRLHNLSDIHATPEGRLAFADALFVPAELPDAFSQVFHRLDDGDALRSRLASLESACAERLAAIETLDAEVRRLQAARPWWRSLVGKRGH